MPPYTGNMLDKTVNTEMMQICKCIIPYLDRDIQKNVAIGVKFLELINTINAFSEENYNSELSIPRHGNWSEDLLHNIRSYVSSDKAYLIDAFLKLQECQSILNVKDSPFPFTSTNSPKEDPLFGDQSYSTDALFGDQSYTNSNEFDDLFGTNHSTNNNTQSTKQNNQMMANTLLDALSPMLDDSQKQMLSLFSTFMGGK